jgi:outer membrane protein assembly factor BamB
MRYLKFIFFLSFFGCNLNYQEREYPAFETGEFWVANFNQNLLQNARLYDDNLYCNTVNNPSGDFLYCLNLKNGKVKWKVPVDNFAPDPVIISNKVIYIGFEYGLMQGKTL